VNLPAPPAPWRLRVFEVLPSTSELCRTLAEAGEPEGLAVLARRQSHGRATRGRAWESPPGNLSLSVLLRPRERVRHAGQWALLAGLALAETLAPYLPAPGEMTLKWPNDVLLGGRKLAGILVDSATDAEGALRYIVIGIGANLAVAPDLPDRATSCLAEVAEPPAAEAFAAALLDRIGHWRRVRLREGFAPMRAAWQAHAQMIGSQVAIKHGTDIFGGTYAGLGEDGSLLLQSGGRVRAFSTGEVLLGHAPS
jgi:BirA family biotin operon repressor/biotin-[acetyl-CoA-carboxylase] ligase